VSKQTNLIISMATILHSYLCFIINPQLYIKTNETQQSTHTSRNHIVYDNYLLRLMTIICKALTFQAAKNKIHIYIQTQRIISFPSMLFYYNKQYSNNYESIHLEGILLMNITHLAL